MAINKPRREQIINEIVSLLNAHTTYSEIFASNGAKWDISRRTFDRYMKRAAIIHAEQQKTIRDQILKDSTIEATERLKTSQISKDAILKKLWDIVENGKRDSDKINACKLICDIEGFKAPEKREIEYKPTPIFWDNPLLDAIN